MRKIRSIRLRLKRSATAFAHDCAGLAATEFAFIVPLMLVTRNGIANCAGQCSLPVRRRLKEAARRE